MSNEIIGFVGLGSVGEKLAKNLIIKKNKLYIFDINKKTYRKFKNKNVYICSSLEELIKNCTVLITCLPSLSSISNVITSISKYVEKKHLWIEMSTTDRNEMIRLAKFFYKKKANVLECPITGGEHKAKSGNISILVSGSKKNYKRAFPILSKMGHQILFCGKLGNSSILKVITNFLASINLLALGEALSVAKKNKIDLGLTHKAIKISSGNSFVNDTETKVILNGSYDVGFTMDLVKKDTDLFVKLAKEYNIPIDFGKIAKKKFDKGIKLLGKKSYSTSIVKLLENQCSIKLRAENYPKKLIDKNPKQKAIEIK